MKSLQTFKFLLLALTILLTGKPALGQERFNIAAGLGYPELLNFGIRYQMGQSQLGLSAGFFPDSYDDILSLGADYYYHFGESSMLATRRLWYGRIGFNYYTIENEYENRRYLLLVPRLGKDFNLSPKLGIAADAGVSLVLSRNEEGFDDFRQKRNDINLSLGFSIFYRL